MLIFCERIINELHDSYQKKRLPGGIDDTSINTAPHVTRQLKI